MPASFNKNYKLPKTKKVIDQNLESLEDFMIRKLKLTESLYIREGVVPNQNQLMRRAVIVNSTTRNSTKVQNEVLISLNRIKNEVW